VYPNKGFQSNASHPRLCDRWTRGCDWLIAKLEALGVKLAPEQQAGIANALQQSKPVDVLCESHLLDAIGSGGAGDDQGASRSFVFLHLTFQEYLVARCLARQANKKAVTRSAS
jgi:hypothetical protein